MGMEIRSHMPWMEDAVSAYGHGSRVDICLIRFLTSAFALAGSRHHGASQHGENVCLRRRGRSCQVQRQRPSEHIIQSVIGQTGRMGILLICANPKIDRLDRHLEVSS